MFDRPLSVRLAGGNVANHCAFVRKNFFRGISEGWIGVNFGFQRRWRWNLPAGQKPGQSHGFVLWFHFRCHPVGVAKFTAEKSAWFVPAQSPARADEPAYNGTAVIAGKIHRTVKTFTMERANHRPALAEARTPALAWHGPYSIQMRQMLEQRRDFLRHEQMKFAVGKMAAQCAECRREQHGVAEIFELEGEDFFRHIRDCRRRGHGSQFSDLELETPHVVSCFRLELQFVQFLINAAAVDELFMAASFHDAALVEYDNQIRVQDG